jgi:hypothetical protein
MDGVTWTSLELDPQGYWSERAVFSSVACRDGEIAMVGAKSGGEAWHRQEVPGSDGFTDLERVIRIPGGDLLAAGIRGDEFGTWQRVDGTWKRLGLFGELDSDRRAGPFVSGLTEAGSQVFASVSDGTSYALWASDDGHAWQPVTTPTNPTTAGEHVMSVGGYGSALLLLADDDENGRVWLAKLS